MFWVKPTRKPLLPKDLHHLLKLMTLLLHESHTPICKWTAHARVNTRICTYRHTYVHGYTCTYMPVFAHAHTCTLHKHLCAHATILPHSRKHMHTSRHINTHMYLLVPRIRPRLYLCGVAVQLFPQRGGHRWFVKFPIAFAHLIHACIHAMPCLLGCMFL